MQKNMKGNNSNLFSVVIPHYNSFEKLQRALNSIPDDPAIEVLVVDDCSPVDRVKLMSLEVSRSNVNLLIADRNRGAGYCRNLGVVRSQGDWILFADSDDYFSSSAWAILKKAINSTSSDCEIIFFPPECVSEDSDISESRRHEPYLKLVNEYLKGDANSIRFNWHSPWSKAIKRTLFDRLSYPYFDEVIASNDVMFSLRTGFFANAVEVFSDSIYVVTSHGESLTKKKTSNVLISRFKVLLDYNEFIVRNGIPSKYTKLAVMLPIKVFRKAGKDADLWLLYKSIKTYSLVIGYRVNSHIKSLLDIAKVRKSK